MTEKKMTEVFGRRVCNRQKMNFSEDQSELLVKEGL